MKTIRRAVQWFSPVLLMGCYAGSQFTLEGPDLAQPVSMTSAIQDSSLRVLAPGESDELGRFSVSFSGWSLGWPLSPNPKQNISDVLNAVVKEKGGNGITQLTIRAANNPVTFVSMFLKGISWVGLAVGVAVLLGSDPHKAVPLEIAGFSAAGILLLPTVGDFTVDGMVVRIKGKPTP